MRVVSQQGLEYVFEVVQIDVVRVGMHDVIPGLGMESVTFHSTLEASGRDAVAYRHP